MATTETTPKGTKELLSRAELLSPAELLSRAKLAIESGESSWRAAAEDIAAAQKQGATQRQIAEAVGKSVGWVNGLLGWRRGRYRGSPFGPQSKASRQRAARVQSPEQKIHKPASASHQAKRIPSHPRELLVKALGMLGSDQAGERANAAALVEQQRTTLGMTWDELIIPADAAKALAA